MHKDKIRLAIVGTGAQAQFHIKALEDNATVELCALCDVCEERVKATAQKNHIERWYTDMEEMFKLPEIDAVLVATGNRFHAACTIAALNAGKHVLCEKPIATTVKEAVQMQEAAQKNEKILMIGHVLRFAPHVIIVKEAVEKGQFGEVYYGKAIGHRRNGHPGGGFAKKSVAAGGVLIDCGIHHLDNFCYINGFPKAVSACGVTFNKLGTRAHIKSFTDSYRSITASADDKSEVEDLASALIRFENGAVFSMEFSYAANIEKDCLEFSLFGTKMGSNYDGSRVMLFSEMNNYLTNISYDTPTKNDYIRLLRQQLEHFGTCIQEGIPCITPAEHAVETMRIIEAIYESAQTGREVMIKR